MKRVVMSVGMIGVLMIEVAARAETTSPMEIGPASTGSVEQVSVRYPALSFGLALGIPLLTTGTAIWLAQEPEPDLDGFSMGLALAGLTVGPSAGHFYSGEALHGFLFSGLRTGALALGLFGLANAVGHHDGDGKTEIPDGLADAMLYTGGICWAALTLWDVIDSVGAARRFNDRQARKLVAVSPLIVPPAKGKGAERAAPAVGLGLVAAF